MGLCRENVEIFNPLYRKLFISGLERLENEEINE